MPADDIVADIDLAYCSACDASFGLLEAPSEPAPEPPPPPLPAPPDSVSLVEGGRGPRVTLLSTTSLGSLPFMVLWTAMAGLFVVIGYVASFLPFLALSSLFFVIGLTVIGNGIYRRFIERRWVELHGHDLVCGSGPFGLVTRSIRLEGTEQFEEEHVGGTTSVTCIRQDLGVFVVARRLEGNVAQWLRAWLQVATD